MLEEILDYIHNYFIADIHKGDFEVESGSINVDFLQEDQYFKIVGSVFNDGVYKFPQNELHDEKFTGEVWSMAVPPSLIKLSEEIQAWVDKYKDVSESPYSSESFGGYSYSKAQASAGAGGGFQSSWQAVFAKRLNKWRKIS